MSSLKVSSLAGRVSGDSPTLTDGAVLPVGVALTGGGGINVTGIITGSSYRGDGSQLTGIDASALKSGGAVKVQATATGAEVTGNLSVGGVLTYQDVQNVDSIGLVTARSGLVVVGGGASITAGGVGINTNAPGAGLNVAGVITATQLDVNGTINQNGSELSAAPTISLVADGAIAANKPVIVTSEGKAKTITGLTESLGSNQTAVSSNAATTTRYTTIAEDTANKRVVYLYRNNAVSPNSTYYVVGTRSGTSITWGTPASLLDSATDGYTVGLVAIGADKFFALYRDYYAGDYFMYVRVISTTSSNTATLGTKVVITDNANNNVDDVQINELRFNPDTNNVIGVYRGGGGGGGTVARMWSISGTTITQGAPVQLTSNSAEQLGAAWMQYKKSLAVVLRWSNNQFNSAIIKEPDSGTTVVVSSIVNVTTNTGEGHEVTFDSVNNVLTGYFRTGNEWQYYAGVWAASGSSGSISWGSGKNMYIGGSVVNQYEEVKLVYVPDVAKYLFVARDSDNDGWITTFEVASGGSVGTSGQELSQPSSATEFDTDYYPRDMLPALGSDAAVLIPFNEAGVLKVRVKQFASTTLKSTNFVGFSDGSSYSDGQTVKINVVGNTTTQSSLTVPGIYYVQSDGTIGATADTPSVIAGRAISSTKLLIQPV